MRILVYRLALILGAGLLCLTLLQEAQAQYITVSSAVSYDAASNKVNGVSVTTMDFYTQTWYRA